MAEITLLDRKLIRPVLIVEDNAKMLETLTRQIRPTGLPVCTSSSVGDARELLSRTTPLAAIVDLAILQGGKDALERMRADSPSTKFFFLADGEERAQLAGVNVDGIYARADTRSLIQELYRLAMT